MFYVRVEGSWMQFTDLQEALENKEQALNSGQSAEIYVKYTYVIPAAPMRAPETGLQSALDEAKAIVYGDREKTYGHPAKNLDRIAGLWREYLNNIDYIHKVTHPLSAQDVAQMMILLKIARLQNQPKHRDSRVDMIGYAALIDRLYEGN